MRESETHLCHMLGQCAMCLVLTIHNLFVKCLPSERRPERSSMRRHKSSTTINNSGDDKESFQRRWSFRLPHSSSPPSSTASSSSSSTSASSPQNQFAVSSFFSLCGAGRAHHRRRPPPGKQTTPRNISLQPLLKIASFTTKVSCLSSFVAQISLDTVCISVLLPPFSLPSFP